jgi:NDP-sugar pyrophosphorylase family protein
MKAMILAAGLGTRLWPLTEDRTKPAVPFLGKPLVQYAVDYVRGAGIRHVVVNTHHKPESVHDALGDGSRWGVRIDYSHEPEILGTGGALDRVRGLLEDDDFVVVNGKIVTDLDLGAAIATHRSRNAIATLVLKPNDLREHFTIVHLDDQGDISRFEGFPDDPDHRGLPGKPLMFTGIQILSPRIFDFIPRGTFSHTTMSAFPDAIRAGERVAAHVDDGTWREMSTLERYLGESLAVMREQGLGLVAGEGTSVDEGALVEDSVLWNDVRVDRGAEVREAILGDGVRIGEGERIVHAAVVRASHVSHVERGEVRGENLVVPLGPVLD